MDRTEVINILRNEQTCVKAADTCDRDCGSCPLVKPTEDILEAYEVAIRMLESPSAQPERSLRFRIGEICIDESKGFISAGRAVEMIRDLLREERREDGKTN